MFNTQFSLCLICFFSHNAVETLAQPANEPGGATKTSEVQNMASQLAQKATKAVEESNPQQASQPPVKMADSTQTNDAKDHAADSDQKAPDKALPGTTEMQKIQPHASSASQSLDLAAEVRAQQVALQQLRDAVTAKQRQIDNLHNDVAMLKESLASKKSAAPVEAFLEKNVVTAETLMSGGPGRDDNFDEGGKPASGGGSDKGGSDAGDDKKSGSSLTMPSALSLIVIVRFASFNSIVTS
eukprot:gnl/MRDRNA2_/MRDRNA2_99027_c0_seq1.p1 gnl/MRDRNA2_/MRDRNA2_99027_c0~~gnl/MRDRNA2_/MRDRNA2_99027_c0_seq1.p1  ORF type:complete len:241 (-),score=66.47 gnl/MRDRNA2_/MRDRNA2_99027_c0_seq1:56-778(-)